MTDIQEKIDAFFEAAAKAAAPGYGWDEWYAKNHQKDLSNHISEIHPELGLLMRLSDPCLIIVIFDGSRYSNGNCSEALELLFNTEKAESAGLGIEQITNLKTVSREFTALDSEWKAILNQRVKQSSKAILITAFQVDYHESQSFRIEGFSESHIEITKTGRY